MSKEPLGPMPNVAAAYVRMSTEHQQYSTSNQMDAIREYAKHRGLDIVQEYSDEGKSGLNIQGRDSLAQMIQDVADGKANYSSILVYDVSRWGRFQDADESAYYEYICRKAGVSVHYCAEQFENDGSPVSTIVKGVKRAMAGEYSRELSSKVFQGACRLIQRGYKQGGTAGYGLRRMLIDQNGAKKAVLKMGEQKSLQTDRVVLVAGPEQEVLVVREIYRAFLEESKLESEIAAGLNAQGLVTDFGRAWTRGTVHEVLTNEKYIGNNVDGIDYAQGPAITPGGAEAKGGADAGGNRKDGSGNGSPGARPQGGGAELRREHAEPGVGQGLYQEAAR
jgi:DNA invertase Pin-like site-specific DNA recombinase